MTDPLYKLDPRHFPALAAVANTSVKRLREAHHLHDLGKARGMADAADWLRENGAQFGAITEAIADAISAAAEEKEEDVRVFYLEPSEVN